MGRVKIQMKKIEARQQRNISFAKRKSGILKKAYELFILCDVQIALFFFSPSGKLFLFDTKKRFEETIMKYINQPRHVHASVPDEMIIRWCLEDMLAQSDSSGPAFRESLDDGIYRQKNIQDEIDECHAKLAAVEQQLKIYLTPPTQWKTTEEVKHQEKVLQETLEKVRTQMHNLEVEGKLTG